jgi:hypothetical protein
MGFESFRVELQGGSATHADADAAVRGLPHVRPDADAVRLPASTYYVLDDGRHVFEIEASDAPVAVSCRFTLCHPPSVDAAFVRLVGALAARLGMEVWIRDDVRPEHASGLPAGRFAEVVPAYIAARRAEWVANVGPEQFPATTREAYERAIKPRCQPVSV